MFHIGQKVVCVWKFVDTNGTALHIACMERRGRDYIVEFPQKGMIYTVRDIVRGFDGDRFRPGLVLAEILNPLSPKGIEFSFGPECFRPLIERKTDISVFTKLLNKTPQKEDA